MVAITQTVTRPVHVHDSVKVAKGSINKHNIQ